MLFDFLFHLVSLQFCTDLYVVRVPMSLGPTSVLCGSLCCPGFYVTWSHVPIVWVPILSQYLCHLVSPLCCMGLYVVRVSMSLGLNYVLYVSLCCPCFYVTWSHVRSVCVSMLFGFLYFTFMLVLLCYIYDGSFPFQQNFFRVKCYTLIVTSINTYTMHSAKKSYVSTQFMHYVFFDTIFNNIRLYEIVIIMFIYLSSTVMDDVSVKLYKYVCDEVVGSEKVVSCRRQFFNVHDAVFNHCDYTWHVISSGSKAEGLNLPGSDFDVMCIS